MKKKNICTDDLIMGEAAVIGAAEAAHLAGVFLGWPFSGCVILFWWLAAVASAAVLLMVLGRTLAGAKGKRAECRRQGWMPSDWAERALAAVFVLMLLSQLLFLCLGEGGFRQGDMTVETVGSFLAADRIYQVNPMTGMPYGEGMPLRLEILCLPTLYGSLCRVSGASPALLVGRIVPAVVLVSCYAAYASLGYSLFPDGAPETMGAVRKKRICFLTVVSLLLWAGAYQYGMDGFNVLCCGWRGVTIRNGILLPWLVSLCVRGKKLGVLACVLAEACIVWTLYGCGACLLAALGMTVTKFVWRRYFGSTETTQT